MKTEKNSAEIIKRRRQELKMSQQDLADRLGVNRSTVSRYESGYIEKMPIDIMIDLANALRTTPEYLMGWTEDPGKPPDGLVDPSNHLLRVAQTYAQAPEHIQRAVCALLNIEYGK